MLAIERNAAGIEGEYLRGLATCFPGAWNETSYRWYLRRPFRSRDPETITVHDGKRLVAGAGINYRRLRSTAGTVHDVGIITAAWTLPKYQGRGCFRRLIEAAMDAGAGNGCEALLSFVTARNASALRLRRHGAIEVPTRYLFLAPEDSFWQPAELPTVHALHAAGWSGLPPQDSRIAFHYASLDEWAAQFIDRPHRTTMFEVDAGVAVLEHVGATDRLQFLNSTATGSATAAAAVVAMASRAQAEGRSFFFFTADEQLAEHAGAHGLRQTAGAIMILELNKHGAVPTALASWASSPWHVQPGDRM